MQSSQETDGESGTIMRLETILWLDSRLIILLVCDAQRYYPSAAKGKGEGPVSRHGGRGNYLFEQSISLLQELSQDFQISL